MQFYTFVGGAFTVPEQINGPGEPMTVEEAMAVLSRRSGRGADALWHGFHKAIEPVEGAIWRVHRHGMVDFLVKYVRPEKVDGLYLPGKMRNDNIVWNWRPESSREAATA